jgi:hypothetical protein
MTTDHRINEKAPGRHEKAREAETHTETRVGTEQGKDGHSFELQCARYKVGILTQMLVDALKTAAKLVEETGEKF